MCTDDFIALNECLLNSKSSYKFAPLLTATLGTRSEEVISIKPEDIDLINKKVRLLNCKNGRNRTINISSEFLFLWKFIKELSLDNKWETIFPFHNVSGYQTILFKKKRATGLVEKYPYETNHAIRKMYAQRRFIEEQLKGKTPQQAWDVVQVELGHGNKSRFELFRAYIGISYQDYLKKFKEVYKDPELLKDLKKQVDYILSFKGHLYEYTRYARLKE